MFESSVNPEGIQTTQRAVDKMRVFESSVNPEGIQTLFCWLQCPRGLRVV